MLDKIKQELKEGKTLLQFGFLKATGQALAMLVPLVVAKFFSPELFGSYSLAKMVVFFFSSLLISSAQTPFIVFANQEKTRSGKINKSFSVQCTFLILSLCIFIAITLSLGKYIIAFAKINRGDLFFVLLAFIGLALKTFLCNLFMAMGQRIKNSLAELAFGSLSLVLIFVFYFLDWINLRSVFMVYLISSVVTAGVFVKAIDFKMLLPFKLEKKSFREMFDFTKWVFLGATAVYFINWGDNLVLRYFVSMEDIGVYNLGYQIFKGIVALTFVLVHYFMPFVSVNIGNKQSMKTYLYSKRPKAFLLGFVPIFILFVFAPYMLKMVYGSIYSNSINVLRILLIGSTLALYSAFYSPVFHALKRYKFSQSVDVMQVFGNIMLNLILIPRMGIYGAAIATVLAYSFRAIIYEIYFRRQIRKLFQN